MVKREAVGRTAQPGNTRPGLAQPQEQDDAIDDASLSIESQI